MPQIAIPLPLPAFSAPTKRCPRCEKTQPLAAFPADRSRRGGVRSTCSACRKADRARLATLAEARQGRELRAALEALLAAFRR